jgi:hypothetical protein
MVFVKYGVRNEEEINEINSAIDDFNKNYNLGGKSITYVVKKQDSPIAPYFLIYPESKNVEIKNVAPINLNSSHMENLLMDNEKETLILLNGNLFRILKQKSKKLEE